MWDEISVRFLSLMRAAQLCIACRIKYRQVELACVAGQAMYEGLGKTCADCEAACRKMADLCLAESPAASGYALDCAKVLEACAKECERSHEEKTTDLAKAAEACLALSQAGPR